MYTETELREALQHSAARAELLTTKAKAENLLSPAVELRIPPAPRRSWLPGAVASGIAAVAVVAVAGGSFLLVARPAHRPVAAPKVSVSVAAPSRTAAASPSRTVVTAPSRTGVAIVNLVTLAGEPGYSMMTDRELLSLPAHSTSAGLTLQVLPANRFDPAKQLTDPRPVTVARTHGYAGKALIDLVDPHAPDADKAGAPINTVAWQASDGGWLVLQGTPSYNPTVGPDLSVSVLIHEAGQLGVQGHPAPIRIPYRAGWLPAGLTLTLAQVSPGQALGMLSLTAGAKSLELQVSSDPFTTPGRPQATKQLAGYTMSVSGAGYDQATVQRVLDNLDLSRLNSSPSTWWTFDQALNH